MTLRDEILRSGQGILCQLPEQIGPALLDIPASSYTANLYSKLQRKLERYIRTIHYTARIQCVVEINSFFDSFFGGQYPNICRMNNVLSSTEIDILLLKALQAGSDASLYPSSQADRADQFGMSVNAIQARIHALEDGKDILGHRVRIDIAGRGQTAYDNTIHPVFLTLNLQEVYLLTIRLKQEYNGTAYSKLADNIAEDVYSQLSDYAKSILKSHMHAVDPAFEDREVPKSTPYRREQQDILYYLKSGETCRMITSDGKESTGKVVSRDRDFFLMPQCGQPVPIPEDQNAYTLTSDQA